MMHDRPSAIIICSYHHLGEVLKDNEVRHVVSIMSDAERARFPAPSFGDRNVLRLAFDDLAYTWGGRFVVPIREHVATLIEFAREWGGDGNLLCHCLGGISRSSAAGMIATAVVRQPDWHEAAMRVAQARAFYRPNSILLAHADNILGLNPGLVDLVRSLPRLDRDDEWKPVAIPLD